MGSPFVARVTPETGHSERIRHSAAERTYPGAAEGGFLPVLDLKACVRFVRPKLTLRVSGPNGC